MKLCFAPMDWITNCATRLITQQVFDKYWKKNDELQLRTEFMNVDGFLINPHQVIKHILTSVWQKPIVQIYWWNEWTLLKAAEKIQHEYSQLFSWIELNTWCPSNTVMKVWGGSDMLKDKEKTLNIIKKLSGIQWDLPFSLKTRAGLNEMDKSEQLDFLVKVSEYCSKISIHGRTLKQLYAWDADWNFIKIAKENVNKFWNSNCEIIWNGWVESYNDAKEKILDFWLNGIMIGQAAIWNPWIFTGYEPSKEERCEILLRHLDYSLACDQWFDEKIIQSDHEIPISDINIPLEWLENRRKENLNNVDFQSHTIVEFRKFLFQYVKWISGSKVWKQNVLSCKWYLELRNQIEDFFSSV